MASTTDRLPIRFVVQHYPNGRAWLELESVDGNMLPGLGNSFLGLDLQEGTDAEKLASVLNESVVMLSHTRVFREQVQEKPY